MMMKTKLYVSISIIGTALVSCNPKSVSQNSTTPEKTTTNTTIDVSFMDKSVRPQDDFFQFANGTWCKNNPVPPSESRWGSFNELDKRNKIILKSILTQAAETKAAKGSQNQLLGDYYKAYTDMSTRNKLGALPLEERLRPILALKGRDELVSVIAELHAKGINCLFGFGVGQDLKNVDKNIVYIGQSGIGLPNRDFYDKENKAEIRQHYADFMTKSFALYFKDDANAPKKMKNAFAFERQLAEAMMTPAESRIPENTYNKLGKDGLLKAFSNFNFEKYVSKLGCENFDSLVVGQPKFIERVNEMIVRANMEQWIDYLSWCVINHYQGMLDENSQQLNFSFYGGVLKGASVMKPADERCIEELTGSTLGELLGKAFVEKTFSEKAKTRVNKMVDNLLIAFRQRIEHLDWMTPETKVQALTKLNSIGRKLGYPDQWKNFTSIEISATNYVQNVDNCVRYSVKENFAKLYKPVDRHEWEMPAHMVNAYYHPLLNEIAFPAGIMQPPFFDENAEDAVNYGRIGMVIGHEFTHGFDDMGSKFAADGSFTNWWSETDRKSFEERTALLGNTFKNFCPIPDNCVNPDLTMGENIADLGGLTMAYYAYAMTDDFKNNVIIEGYTPAQRFFIAYAQLWKINYTDAELKNRIATDSHSPGMFRVNGPLMNCPEFFAAFKVQVGDKMRNPDAQVSKIW